MQLTIIIAAITTASALSGILGYFLMRAKLQGELSVSKKREEELERFAYETAILKEIGDRIGYSLDANKIVEIISGSLGKLVPYSTVSHMIFDKKTDRLLFSINIADSVSNNFIADVERKMINAVSEMLQNQVLESDIDMSVSGNVLNDENKEPVRSFFNLPIFISGQLIGIINVSSTSANLYNDENTEVLYRIARLASDAVSKLQEVLENEKSRLSQAVASLSDGLLMVDKKFQLVLVNKKLTALLGTIDNPTLFDIANSLSGKFDLRTKMEEAFANDAPLPALEITVADKTLQVVTAKVVDKKLQKPIGVVVLFHDVTDAKSLEKLRADFTSMMVHELRAPLTSIKSTTELLEQEISKLGSEQIINYLKTIDSTSNTMLELVNDLLDIAKMESGKFDVVLAEGDISQVITERAEGFRPQAQAKNLKLTVDISRNLPRAYFDKVRIKQVLNNLISNAIKYTESGEIIVSVAAENINGDPVDILVSVIDTGIGISEEEGEKLFSRFGQVERGKLATNVKSSGLGLFITRGIVEGSGGRIWYKSEGENMGSTFYFTVLLAQNLKKGQDKMNPVPSRFSTMKVAHG